MVLPAYCAEQRRIAGSKSLLGNNRHCADCIKQGVVVNHGLLAPLPHTAYCQMGRAALAAIGND
jgi:hypothetical protein